MCLCARDGFRNGSDSGTDVGVMGKPADFGRAGTSGTSSFEREKGIKIVESRLCLLDVIVEYSQQRILFEEAGEAFQMKMDVRVKLKLSLCFYGTIRKRKKKVKGDAAVGIMFRWGGGSRQIRR